MLNWVLWIPYLKSLYTKDFRGKLKINSIFEIHEMSEILGAKFFSKFGINEKLTLSKDLLWTFVLSTQPHIFLKFLLGDEFTFNIIKRIKSKQKINKFLYILLRCLLEIFNLFVFFYLNLN